MFADPTIANRLDRERIQVVPPIPAFASHDDQVGVNKYFNVLHYVGAAQMIKDGDKLPSGLWAFCQLIKDLTTSFVGQSSPNIVVC